MAIRVDKTIAQLPVETLLEFGYRIVDRAPEAAQLAPFSRDELGALADGRLTHGEHEAGITALVAWIDQHRDVISETYPSAAPPFDHLQSYWDNFFRGPRGSGPDVRASAGPSATLLGFELDVPFGVPACAVTPHSGYIELFANRGFDLLTYKTVRSSVWNAYPSPNLGFAADVRRPLRDDEVGLPIVGTLHPDALHASADASFVNSIGVPSLPVEQWMADVARTRQILRRGKVLIVSVMGSPEELGPDEGTRLVDQFARVAGSAKEAGADIVELNLSCPNTGGDLLCRDSELSGRILRRVRQAVGDTPILIKISYMPDPLLEALVAACRGVMNGVVAINAIQLPTHDLHGEAFFRDRSNDLAGLSGIGIRDLGLAVTRKLSALRGDDGPSPEDWVIVGIGGVMSAADYQAYRDQGADAVQSCTGAWLNPDLARQVRVHVLGDRDAGQEESKDGELDEEARPDDAWASEEAEHPWRRLFRTVNDAVRTGGLSLRVEEPAAQNTTRRGKD